MFHEATSAPDRGRLAALEERLSDLLRATMDRQERLEQISGHIFGGRPKLGANASLEKMPPTDRLNRINATIDSIFNELNEIDEDLSRLSEL